MKVPRDQLATYLAVLAVLIIGVSIRGTSLITNGTGVLLDLDPFHTLRAVESIMATGNIPGFDALSAAPNGTRYAFATSQGYYGFIASLGLLAGLSPSEALAISPLIFFALELISILAITLTISKSILAGLFASLFATGLTGWAAISVMGGDPVAENLGAFLFLSTIVLALFQWERPSYTLIVLLGFLDGISIEAHPVTYYFVTLVLATGTIALLLLREWKKASSFVFSILISTYSLILLQISGAGLAEAGVFSASAFWLASLSHIYTLDNSTLIDEVGVATLLLALVSIGVILRHRLRTKYFLIAWSGILYAVILVGELAIFTPYGSWVEGIPFSAPLVLTHRVMPYLPPAICVLGGVAVGEFVIPSLASLAKRYGIRGRNVAGITILIVLAVSAGQLFQAHEYSISYAYTFNTGSAYSQLSYWIGSHTAANSVFVANDVSIGVYVKAMNERQVFFTTSQEDLTVPDLTLRATLQTCLFLPLCTTNATMAMIRSYRINYAIIITPAQIVDQNATSFVKFNEDQGSFAKYLDWFQSRPGFVQVYNDSDSAVFSM